MFFAVASIPTPLFLVSKMLLGCTFEGTVISRGMGYVTAQAIPAVASDYHKQSTSSLPLTNIGHSNLSIATAVVSLRRNNLVVVAPKRKACVRPGVKVAASVHRTPSSLLLADRPVLIKDPGTLDTGLVVERRLPDAVH